MLQWFFVYSSKNKKKKITEKVKKYLISRKFLWEIIQCKVFHLPPEKPAVFCHIMKRWCFWMVVILAVWLLILLSVIVIRYAIAMSLQNKQRVIYTTPIKVSTWHTCKMRAVAKILSCRVNASSRSGRSTGLPGGPSPPPSPYF